MHQKKKIKKIQPILQEYKPKLFDLLLISEVKLLKEQLTMSTSYIDPYFSLRGNFIKYIKHILFQIVMQL